MRTTFLIIVMSLGSGLAGAAGCSSTPRDSAELAALYKADQADRTAGSSSGDWGEIARNDESRGVHVRRMLEEGRLRTGADYFHAAMIFQHAAGIEGVQLAHELAMISACLGDERAKWLAAATYDRMLMNMDRPQRFGTQYRAESGGPMRLWTVADGVTDGMREALNVPTLEESRAREAEMQRMMEELESSKHEAGEGSARVQ